MRDRLEIVPPTHPGVDIEDTDKLPATGRDHLRLARLELNVPNLDKTKPHSELAQ